MTKKILKLRGKTAVFIDWANVYGWSKPLKKTVIPQKLFEYLKNYPEIESINFYFGTDKRKKSKKFLRGVILILKFVWLPIRIPKEATRDLFTLVEMEIFNRFINILPKRKNKLSSFMPRLVYMLRKRIYKLAVNRLSSILKKCPRTRRGAITGFMPNINNIVNQ